MLRAAGFQIVEHPEPVEAFRRSTHGVEQPECLLSKATWQRRISFTGGVAGFCYPDRTVAGVLLDRTDLRAPVRPLVRRVPPVAVACPHSRECVNSDNIDAIQRASQRKGSQASSGLPESCPRGPLFGPSIWPSMRRRISSLQTLTNQDRN
jgi:hypothetical protein